MQRPVVNRPLIFAHRGASKVAPENTLPAFEAAILSGADGVELDVQYSSDGHLMVIHDLTLERLTNGIGRVTAQPVATLRSLDAGSHFGPEFAGTRIPRLGDVLDLLKDRLLVNVELKVPDTSSVSMGADVVAAVRAHGMADQVVISSFNPFALRKPSLPGQNRVRAAGGAICRLDAWADRRHSRHGITEPVVNGYVAWAGSATCLCA
jgi:glycerophosphoryl diester phosphodiesterase